MQKDFSSFGRWRERMKHTIMCSCGKLAIKCKEASKGLQIIVNNGKRKVFDDTPKVDNLQKDIELSLKEASEGKIKQVYPSKAESTKEKRKVFYKETCHRFWRDSPKKRKVKK